MFTPGIGLFGLNRLSHGRNLSPTAFPQTPYPRAILSLLVGEAWVKEREKERERERGERDTLSVYVYTHKVNATSFLFMR